MSAHALETFNETARIIAHLHRDSGANALAVGHVIAYADSLETVKQELPIVIKHAVAAGATDATTFKIRSGTNAAVDGGTLVVAHNGVAAAFGGTRASSITITEILP